MQTNTKTKPKHQTELARPRRTVADFFAGIGLVSMGLERAGWQTVYALDYDAEKEKAYTNNFGTGHYHTKDIAIVKGKEIPNITLAHASFPCTDLSVAGERKGINQGESSSFWHFIRVITEMKEQHGQNRPPIILLENVEGLLSSAGGKDLKSVLTALNRLGYSVDLLLINAWHFVPQSRSRIFIIGIHKEIVESLDLNLLTQERNLRTSNARPKKITEYIDQNPDIQWYFHQIPNLPDRNVSLKSIIDLEAEWWPKERTEFLYNQLHQRHKEIINRSIRQKGYSYFPAFRRMRLRDGKERSTVEIRTDGIAGCLRTPKGGSARQILVRAGNQKFDARLINEKEAARLMGADEFRIDSSLGLNQVLFGFGDAVCVPVVEWIAKNYLDRLPI